MVTLYLFTFRGRGGFWWTQASGHCFFFPLLPLPQICNCFPGVDDNSRICWGFPGNSVVRMLSFHSGKAQVWSLVRELRSHMHHSVAKKNPQNFLMMNILVTFVFSFNFLTKFQTTEKLQKFPCIFHADFLNIFFSPFIYIYTPTCYTYRYVCMCWYITIFLLLVLSAWKCVIYP